jgi:NADH dehydrogenase (ubiquinone) Fe-S protein 6
MSHDPELVPEITLVDSLRVWCDGAGDIRGGENYRPASLGHPRVWMQIDEKGFVDCGYCDRRFVLEGGPADDGTIPDVAAKQTPEADDRGGAPEPEAVSPDD